MSGMELYKLSWLRRHVKKIRFTYLKSNQIGSNHSLEDLLSLYIIQRVSMSLFKHAGSANLLGKHLKISDVGKGECTNNPILALGYFSLIMDGTSSK